MDDEKKRKVEQDRRTREARFRVIIEPLVEDFVLGPDRVLPPEGRTFEITTESYVIRGRVTALGAASDATETSLPDAQHRQGRNADAIVREVDGIAHELNHLLASIRGYGHAMLRELNEPHRSFAREIVFAAEAAAALTFRLLTPADG